jgi:hypothetical protein
MYYFKIIFLLLSLNSLYSCEEVVQVDLVESEPRLVIEASILWRKNTVGNVQLIRLTTTAPFFDDQIPPAEGASVSVYSETGMEFAFEEIEPGIFRNDQFVPQLNKPYELEIEYKDEVYSATETLLPVAPLEYIEQTDNGGFGGEDLEFKAYFTDPPNIQNYYLVRFFYEDLSIQIYEDEFTDGNQTFAYFSNEDLTSGEEVGFEIQGISKRFYEYLFILRSQAGASNGGPFQTQPTTVRGNIINTTNPDNFAFGYFRLSEMDFLDYTIQ